MLIPHQFDKEKHIYKVRNHYVFSTSDVIAMNGLSFFGQVPEEVLAKASQRGVEVHSAVEAHGNQQGPPPMCVEARERFLAYRKWAASVGWRVAGPSERTMVYLHHGTEVLIGATPDCIGYVNDELYVVDVKNCFRSSGAAKAMKMLEWRMQLQSYKEALQDDEELWETLGEEKQIKRGLLHLNPDCGIEKRGGPRLGYEFHTFDQDDEHLWDSMIRVCHAKFINGHKVPDRGKVRNDPPFNPPPQMYIKPEGVPF